MTETPRDSEPDPKPEAAAPETAGPEAADAGRPDETASAAAGTGRKPSRRRAAKPASAEAAPAAKGRALTTSAAKTAAVAAEAAPADAAAPRQRDIAASVTQGIAIIAVVFAALLAPPIFTRVFALRPMTEEAAFPLWFATLALLVLAWFVRQRRMERTALVLLTVLFLVGLELCTRFYVAHLAPQATHDSVVRAGLIAEPKEWKFRPHPFLQYVGNSTYQTQYLSFNAVGFPGPELPRTKAPGTIRVLCIGGSTTEDGYPEKMQAWLNSQHGGDGVRFEVMNYGLQGYTSAHSVISFILDGIDYAPDYVVFDHGWNDKVTNDSTNFTDDNFRSDYSHSHKEFALPYSWDAPLIRASVIYRELKNAVHPYDGWTAFADAIHRLRPEDSLPQTAYHGVGNGPNNLQTLWRNAETVIDVAEARGIRPVIVTQAHSTDPNIPRAEEAWFMDAANKVVRDASAGRSDILFVDVDARMTGNRPIYFDLGHMTEDGKEEKAEIIGSAIYADFAARRPATAPAATVEPAEPAPAQ